MTRLCSALTIVVFITATGATMSIQPPGGPPTSQPTSRPEAKPGLPERPSLPDAADMLIDSVERAHGADAWAKQTALRTDIHVEFGGAEYIDGVMTFELHTGRSRIELKNGTVLVFDGERAWLTPAKAKLEAARFHLLTWPYFLAVPFKLDDPGAQLVPGGLGTLNLRMAQTAKLTFAAGTGDTPGDWYIVYVDSGSSRLTGLAYIVTYGTTVQDAAEEPHAIVYDDYLRIDGVTLSTTWTFYNWEDPRGTYGDPIGHVRMRNLEFITPEDGLFDRPRDSREDAVPVS